MQSSHKDMKRIFFVLLIVVHAPSWAMQAVPCHSELSSEVPTQKKVLSFEQKQALKNAFCSKLIASSYGAVAQHYLQELEAEHESLKQELCLLVSITPEMFQQRFVDYYNYFSEQEHIAYPGLDTNNIQIIETSDRHYIDTVLEQTGIDRAFITVVCHTCVQDHSSFVSGFNTVFIDASKIPTNQNIYKALIGHELTHVIFDDWVLANVVNYYCGKEHTDFANKYSRFCEKRADILGCLLSCQSAYAWACNFAKSPLHQGPPTHPANHLRAAYLYKLSSAIKQEQLQNTGAASSE